MVDNAREAPVTLHHVLSSLTPNLASVTENVVDLLFYEWANVDDVVGVLGSGEQQGRNAVWLGTLALTLSDARAAISG